MMDEKMRTAFRAWHDSVVHIGPEDIVEWTIYYLRCHQEPVAAQHRFRSPQKTRPNWSIWQPCAVANRPSWDIDSQGYEVEYRNLYAAPVPAAQPEQITPKQLARLIADNPDAQFSVKPRPADEELRRDAERMRIAADAPNLHAQVYLYCRLHAATHDQALDIAHDAEKMHGPEQVSEADLRIIIEEIRSAIAAEKLEGE